MNSIRLLFISFTIFINDFSTLCANSVDYFTEPHHKRASNLYIAPSLPQNAPLAFECSENVSLDNIDFVIHFKKISFDSHRKPLDIWMVKLEIANPDFSIESSFYTDWERGQKLYFNDGCFSPYTYLDNNQCVELSSYGFSFYVRDKTCDTRYGPIQPVFELPTPSSNAMINACNAGRIENFTYYYLFTPTYVRWKDYQQQLNDREYPR